MRETSLAENISVQDIFSSLSPEIKEFVSIIRKQKNNNLRPRPSESIVDNSKFLTKEKRMTIIDKIASLVDENLFGRSEMCFQFADLLHRALTYLQIPSTSVIGDAIYYHEGKEIFRWQHAWVRAGDEIIDGNVDSTFENPYVPSILKLRPYWGPITETPNDRRLHKNRLYTFPQDSDVENIWWPELKAYIDENF